MDVSALADLLGANQFAACKEAAETLLRRGGLEPLEKAQLYLALSGSLDGLQSYQEALGPAELAVHYSRDGKDYDLLGRALYQLISLSYENELYKRALQALEEYFRYIPLYDRARRLEGWGLYQASLCYRAMERRQKALEYAEKAYRWFTANGASPEHLDQVRSELTEEYLRQGNLERAAALLKLSHSYIRKAPEHSDAKARYLTNAAYRYYLLGDYKGAVRSVGQVLQLRGISPQRKARACLTLHYTAKGMGLSREALGAGLLAKIHADLARRKDLEEEAARSLLQVQQPESLPRLDELLRTLQKAGRQPKRKPRASG